MQIPQQTGLECHPGFSCSKKLRGQTCQVNLCQSDRATPKLAPFSLKTHGAPERLSSFLTLQARGDLLPRYAVHINISSTCHHPGLWGDFSRRRGAHFLRFIHCSAADETLWSARDRIPSQVPSSLSPEHSSKY